MSQMSIDFLVGILTDCTGVKYYGIGIFRIYHLIAHLLHDSCNGLCLDGVHLASFILDMESRAACAVFSKKFLTFLNVLKLKLCFFILAQIDSSNKIIYVFLCGILR